MCVCSGAFVDVPRRRIDARRRTGSPAGDDGHCAPERVGLPGRGPAPARCEAAVRVLGEGLNNIMRAVTPPLVGRDAELTVLRTVLSRALEGRARVVALSGPAGVGKSRLAEECLVFARDSGFLVLRGAGGALQRDLTYAPLVEALRPLVCDTGARGGSVLVDGLPDLGQLFGELSLPPGPVSGPAGLERTRLFESVCRLLERASARQPVALMLDDVHWADRGSLALLHYLVRGLDSRPLLVVLTYRDDEAEAALDELLAGLRRTGMFTELPLMGLTEVAVGGLVRDLLNGEVPEGLLETLTARSGGLPLFVSALVGSLIETGALRRSDDGRWTLGPQQLETVPAAVSALLRSRIERLSVVAREVLDLLAVCGAQAEHGLLERLVPSERLLIGLVELRASGVVWEEVVDDRVRYRPVHPLICEVAYELLPLVSRRRRHAEVYRAVREHTPQLWGVLAQHVRAAGEEIDRDHALEVLMAATAHELARGVGDEAVPNVRAAIDLAGVLNRPEELDELHDRLAEAYELAGDREQAVSGWVVGAARRGGVIDRAERLHRAAILEREAGRTEECRHYLAEASAGLTRVSGGPAGTRASAAQLALAVTELHLAYRSGSSPAIEAAIAGVERFGESLESPMARIAVLVGRWQIAFAAGRYLENREHLSDLQALAGQLGDARVEWVVPPAGILELSWGDLPAGYSIAEDGLRQARRAGAPWLRLKPLLMLGGVAFFSGEWSEAERRSSEAIDLAERVGMPRFVAWGLAQRGLVLVRRGQLDEARVVAAGARQVLGEEGLADRHIVPLIEAVETSAALARGDAATAVAMATESLRRHTQFPGFTLMILAEAQICVRDEQAALETARTLSALGPGAPYPGAVASWIRGRVDRDETLVRGAADQLAGLGFVYEAAVARLDLAEQSPHQVDDLGDTLRTLERLGAQPQCDRARRLMRRLGQRRPAPSRAARAGPLSPREEQVARLVAEGLSNPEIARRLYLSLRTVTTHLQNMYGRLGLTSRTALARYVLTELPPDTHRDIPNT